MKAENLLPPFPNGWYAVNLSRALPIGGVRPLQFMGEEVVLFRTQGGEPCLVDAYCPHLGAHLGYGGAVVDETIRCPFHGFCYDTNGRCVSTPYGSHIPPKAVAHTYPLKECHGLILAYHHANGEAPSWAPPTLEVAGWSSLLSQEWTLRGHPQETTENSVDVGHFSQIHGYTAVEMLQELVTEGPYLNVRYAMSRNGAFFGRPVRAEFEIHAYGLGYSLVELTVPTYELHSRLFVLATPIDRQQIRLRVAVQLRQDNRPARIHPLLALAPPSWVNRLLARQTFNGLVRDVQQDFMIWQHKRYVQPPILAAGDGPVGKFRIWARQFYPEAERVHV
jgi:phenylpropionate dioxygenase-like ring-hydroxylating dioxygenase large terminal subunit